MCRICKTCGQEIADEISYEVNHGLLSAYFECERCHADSWEHDRIIRCEACGEWYEHNVLRSESLSDEVSFAPCPHCGNDIVEGMTREEMKEEYEIQ